MSERGPFEIKSDPAPMPPGKSTTPLFVQGGANGMSLMRVWFGPNFPLFRHSHPRYGDDSCENEGSCQALERMGDTVIRPAGIVGRLETVE